MNQNIGASNLKCRKWFIFLKYEKVVVLLCITIVLGDSSGTTDHIFSCPDGEYITGINYRYTEVVNQLEFLCTSNYTIGPFGGNDAGRHSSLLCNEQHYITTFYINNNTNLDRLGIRCLHQNDKFGKGKLIGSVGKEVTTTYDGPTRSYDARPTSGVVTTGNNNEIVDFKINYSAVDVGKLFSIICNP